jgi:hypothetical protein
MSRARVWLCGAAAVLVIAAGVAYLAFGDSGGGSGGDSGGLKGATRLAQFSDQGVTVVIGVKDRTATHATLVATLTPERPGFHLYSIDLPPDGIQGVGRPISLNVQGSLSASGPLAAQTKATTLRLAGTDLTLPVYPDGPVTVDLPVTIGAQSGATGHSGQSMPGAHSMLDAQSGATALVGYAACSESACLPPVSGHAVQLTLP